MKRTLCGILSLSVLLLCGAAAAEETEAKAKLLYQGHGSLLKSMRALDVPGVDVIWRQICPETKVTVRNEMNGCNGFFPRYASSAAAQPSSSAIARMIPSSFFIRFPPLMICIPFWFPYGLFYPFSEKL